MPRGRLLRCLGLTGRLAGRTGQDRMKKVPKLMTMRGGEKAGWGLGGEGSVCDVCPRPLAPFDPCWERQNTQVFPLTSVDGIEDVRGNKYWFKREQVFIYR